MAAERVHTFLVQRPTGGKPERIVVWDTQDISVGRAPENDVVVEDPETSRTHCHFYRSDGGFSVRNMSLSNPTFVNGEAVESQALKNESIVRVADTEFIFYSVTRNPATLRIKVEYASQLKDFGPKMVSGDGEATILGLVDTVGAAEEEFEVRPAADFEHDLHGVEPPPRARNLDVELADPGLEDLEMPAKPGARAGGEGMQAWTLEEEPKTGTLSLHLEIEGLTGAQRMSVAGLLGKVIQLPQLRIRIKGDDLG